MKNYQLQKNEVWQPKAMFTEVFKYVAEWQICKTAKNTKLCLNNKQHFVLYFAKYHL